MREMEKELMNDTIKIALLYLIILAAQAFYMYLSSKNLLKSNWYLYILAIPLVTAFPVIMYSQDKHAFNMYEYAVVICIITAAIADVVYAAGSNKDYMSGEAPVRFLYAYLMIVAVVALLSSASMPVKIISVLLLAAAVLVCTIMKKHPAKEVLKAPVLALFSVACSWSFLTFVL